jgi:N-methylhydantoinase A
MALDHAAAERAMQNEIADKLDLALDLAALGVSEIVDENMANAARVHAIESGKDARGRTLVAFGGAAPLHASRLADKLGLDRVLVPSNAGVGSAVGFLRAPIGYEVVRTQLQRLDSFDAYSANALLAAMYKEAETIVRRGEPKAVLTETRSALMRYRGQGHEIAVPLTVKTYRNEDASEIIAAFEDAYRRLYSRIIPGVEVEVLSWVVLVSGPAPVAEAAPPAAPKAFAATPARRRPIFDPESAEFVEVAIYERAALTAGARMTGPGVIIEDETSTVIGRNFDARIDAYGYIELVRRGS